MQTVIQLTLDDALVSNAKTLGPLDSVVDQALRRALDPAELARRRRWVEENALLMEAASGGVEEVAHL